MGPVLSDPNVFPDKAAASDSARVPFPIKISDDTRRIFASALQALARDLLLEVPDVSEANIRRETADEFRKRLFGPAMED